MRGLFLTVMTIGLLLVSGNTVRAQEGSTDPAPATVPLDTIEGRPAASVPTGPNVAILAPSGTGVVLYETQRIKRTPPLNPADGLQGKWDPLYTAQDGTGTRTAYMDWDDDFLYLALEVPSPRTVRFELDLRDDGWLRGADNVVLQVAPDGNTVNGVNGVLAYRFDTVQNRNRPVYAAAPVPVAEMRVRSGRTPNGTYAVTVGIPRREDAGLNLKPGDTFGIFVNAGDLPDPADETELSLRPMMRVTLAEEIPAKTAGGLLVKIALDNRDNAPGEGIKATLEIKNESTVPLRTGRMFLRGSLSSVPFVDSASFALQDIEPGKTVKKELRSSVAPTAPLGAIVVAGGFETADGGTITTFSSFNRVEPYDVSFEVEQRPVVGAGETTQGDTREAKVVVKSRVKAKDDMRVTLSLPEGWSLTSGKDVETKQLKFQGDTQGIFYKILVPANANPGEYPVSVTVEVGGKTYRRSDTIAILR